ncbi:head-tail connector protein [Nafulsella turpanensis]|uniref:phage gp6-like head-tail connector protein n=1 Tax=Nafulsella turpanensis TaxID=1265690 RepID=UPI00034A8992|nr:phage gp6-like head-tail connector protein [Nafulsella turpanensis]
MRTKVISRTFNHITLQEIKHQTKVSEAYTADDIELNNLLKVATDMAGNYIENVIALTSFETKTGEFSGTKITINRGHFYGIDSITYTDRYNQTITVTAFEVEAEDRQFTITFDSWIDATEMTINFKCGFDALTIPPVVKQAILIKLTDLYDIERASYTSGSFQLNKAFENLLNYHKRINIF